MQPQTERYLDQARAGRNAAWRYLVGVLLIAVCWLVLGYLPYVALVAVADAPGPVAEFVALNLSILMMLAGLALAVKHVHGRPLMSLVSPDRRLDGRRLAGAAWAWFVIAAACAGLEQLLFPGRYDWSFDPLPFLTFLAAVAVFTPLQCATEELVFRGYALQGLALLTRRPLVLAAASSVIFTLPHLLNPEVGEHGVLVMAANYFAIGMVLATVTLRDGRLELAIGLHTANNVFLAVVANYEHSALATSALFTAAVLDPWYSLVTLVAGGLAFHAWMFRRRAPRAAAPGGGPL